MDIRLGRFRLYSFGEELTVKVAFAMHAATPTCSAHNSKNCKLCRRNGPTCSECSYYNYAGLHWDTCANRIR